LGTPPQEVESVLVSPQGRWLAYRLNVDGKSDVKLRDLKSGKTISPPGLPLGVPHGLEFSPDDGRLAFIFDGPRHNPDVWIWDLGTSQIRQPTPSSGAGIAFSQFVEPELIHYPTFDGKKIPAWFYKPKAPVANAPGSPPPVIVYPHGGPESQTRPNFS